MARKRGNNEGSVYFDASGGKWKGVVIVEGKRKTVVARTRAGAAARLVELQSKIASGLPMDSDERLGPFLDWWLTTLDAKVESGDLDPKTVSQKRGEVNKWIAPQLGNVRLRDLEPEHVERLLVKMVDAGLSRSSVVRVKTDLGQALRVAERRGKVSRNVAALAERPATKPPVRKDSFTPNQAKAFLAAAKDEPLEAMWVMGLTMGLRPGELAGLRWTDVDLDVGRLTVEHSRKVGEKGGKLYIGDTKTEQSRRPLSIPPGVVAALEAHRKRQALQRSSAGTAWQEMDLVFCTSVGTPLDPSSIRKQFKEVCEKANLGRWTPNQMRHSAASLLSAAGVPLEVVADVLGHASTRMLEKHYRQQLRPSLDAHIDPMNALLES